MFASQDADSDEIVKQHITRSSLIFFLVPFSLLMPIIYAYSTSAGSWGYNKGEGDEFSEAIDQLLSHYLDIPQEGSPFVNPSGSSTVNTSSPFDHDSRLFDPLQSNQFKRIAAMFGDLIFESGRRLQLDAHNEQKRAKRSRFFSRLDMKVPIWSYHFRQPVQNAPIHFGVYHSTEIQFGKCFVHDIA